jgi:hypothetical protein
MLDLHSVVKVMGSGRTLDMDLEAPSSIPLLVPKMNLHEAFLLAVFDEVADSVGASEYGGRAAERQTDSANDRALS